MTKTESDSRIAKRLARSGVGSRRYCEGLVFAGKVMINGVVTTNPAIKVNTSDRIKVNGKIMPNLQATRIWRYHKPIGLVTTRKDEKNRSTIFDNLPTNLPYTMPIGRLDINSEGLLLLTNDGEFKRYLEHPATGMCRKYRIRVHGNPTPQKIKLLEKGIKVGTVQYAPMIVKLDSQLGANAWMTIVLREGKNREIRKTLAAVGMQVSRLIRINYGPFELGNLEKNQVVEAIISNLTTTQFYANSLKI